MKMSRSKMDEMKKYSSSLHTWHHKGIKWIHQGSFLRSIEMQGRE